METMQLIEKQINSSPVIIYIKGTPQMPQCGFSAKAVTLLVDAIKAANQNLTGFEFQSVNVLENPEIRKMLPQYSNWPTFPQLFVNGELIGGCDIITEMHQKGELQQMMKDVFNK